MGRMGREGLVKHLENRIIHETLVRYNYSGDYAREVEDLHRTILTEFYPGCKDVLVGDTMSQINFPEVSKELRLNQLRGEILKLLWEIT